MKIIKLNKTNQGKIIEQTIKVLNHGGLVVFPSDTVYGLLADVTNPKAIDKLLAFKQRPAGKAISVFVADEEMADKYVEINQNAKNVIKNLLPGPFTVVCKAVCKARPCTVSKASPCETKIDPRLLAENGTLGFRIPDYSLVNDLLIAYGLPLTATSANISSTPPHYSINGFLKARPCYTEYRKASPYNKLSLISLIVDAGKLPKNKPSTVIDTTTGSLKTLRFGDLLPKTPNSLISKSEKETKTLAGFILSKALKKSLGKPIVFLLEGDLGAGKTIFTKGLGKALKIKDEIVSPTYTICYEYKMTPQCHPELVEGSLSPATNKERDSSTPLRLCSGSVGMTIEQSTKNNHLSTGSPIKYRQCSDMERLDPNTSFLHQGCKNSIKKQVLSIKQGGKEKNLLNTNYLILNTSLFVHYDLYRIESPEDLAEIKFLESIQPGNIYAVEWPERLDKQTISKLKEITQVTFVKIRHLNEKEREISWGN